MCGIDSLSISGLNRVPVSTVLSLCTSMSVVSATKDGFVGK